MLCSLEKIVILEGRERGREGKMEKGREGGKPKKDIGKKEVIGIFQCKGNMTVDETVQSSLDCQ